MTPAEKRRQLESQALRVFHEVYRLWGDQLAAADNLSPKIRIAVAGATRELLDEVAESYRQQGWSVRCTLYSSPTDVRGTAKTPAIAEYEMTSQERLGPRKIVDRDTAENIRRLAAQCRQRLTLNWETDVESLSWVAEGALGRLAAEREARVAQAARAAPESQNVKEARAIVHKIALKQTGQGCCPTCGADEARRELGRASGPDVRERPPFRR